EKIADGKDQLKENREKIEEGWKQTEEARTQIKEGRKEIADARKEIANGRKETSQARQEIAEGREQAAQGRAKIAEGRAQLEEGRAQLEEKDKELSYQEAQLEEAAPQIEALKQAQEMGMELTEEQLAMIAAYDEGVAQTQAAREQLEAARAELDAQAAQLDASEALLDEKDAEMDAGEAILDEKEAEMDEAEKLLDAKEAEIDEAEDVLDEKEAELEAGEAELDKGEQDLLKEEAKLDEAESKLDSKESEARDGLKEIDSASALLDSKEAELEDGGRELVKGENELRTAQQEVTENEAKLRDSEAELKDKEAELIDAEKEYEKAKAKAEKKIADGEKELADAKAEIDDIEEGKWIIRDRTDNLGMSSYKDDSAKIGAIAKIFPVFFFVIAALVALTTLTRLVEEEREKIGALKSLGYSNRDIRRYYLLYGLAASVLGCAIGIPAGSIFFPKVISNAYDMLYVLPDIDTPVLMKVAAPVAIGLTAMILLSTWYSSREILKEKPAALLLPRAPKAGKRILLERVGFIWKHLNFSRKVTLRNIFRYKKRFLMTIIGVAGCFALLLTGFGVRDSIGNIVELHYGELMHFDYTAQIEEYEALTDDSGIKDILDDPSLTADWAAAAQESVTLSFKGKKESSTIFVPEVPEKLEDFVTLRERIGHAPVALTEDGAVLTEKSAENLGAKIGDTLTLTTDDGTKTEIVLTGITENYVNSSLYIHPSYYAKVMDDAPDYTTLYFKAGPEGTEGALAEKLLNCDNVLYVLETQVVRDNFAKSVKSIDYIILVLIVASGALAIIVLYNLTNVNICERKKELATIRVLGFYHHEVSAYIFREVDILAVLGILAGIPVGIWLHHFIIITVEVAGVMFGRSINPTSYLIAAAFTILFTLAVNLIMRRTIRKIDMVESMKAVD
ncbi:MAG: FtsX-like permease family protein, partial [Firmicutes bacterium]|nr:FtsX-like permease family protein [Bacillota bacterium]